MSLPLKRRPVRPTLLPFRRFAIAALLVAVASTTFAEPLFAQRRRVHTDRSRKGMVVSVGPLASQVGADVLQDGGTAVDAAVATAFALAVVWPEAGNIGGGGFMLVHPPEGDTVCIDYREMAPGRATRTMYDRNSSTLHPLAVGVPGTVRGLETAHKAYGRLPWKRLVRPAVELARDGFAIDELLAGSINSVLARSDGGDPRFAELHRVYGRPDGKPWQVGQTIKLPELANTLEKIALEGADGFYRGPIAEMLADEMRRGEGLISVEDLAAYQAKVRPAVQGAYRGYTIYGAPPPASGGVCAVLTMQILEPYRLRKHERFSTHTLHVTAEAMKRSFLQRAKWLGDPDFVEIPEQLTSPAFARQLAKDIKLDRATPSESLAPEIALADESDQTTHFSVVDASGMAVANTYTLEASWGSRVVVRGAGFVLNNEMGDFNWFPGVTNRSGRIGTDANLIEPGKRMLSSQSPTIVCKDGKPILVTGSPGGRRIINTVVNVLLNVLEYEMPLEEAITIRRTHHQWLPDALYIEAADDPRLSKTIAELKQRGHTVLNRTRQGSAHSIAIDPESGEQLGVADWRRGGRAVGVK